MATQSELADDYHAAQAQVSAAATQAVLTTWLASYEPGNSSLWRALLAALAAIVGRFRSESSRLAITYYMNSRAAAQVPGLYVPRPAPDPPALLLERTAQITGARAYGRSLAAGRSAEWARQNAGVQLAGAMARIALDAGRQTVLDAVEEDREAIGWIRITDVNPCAFCAMLASRGASYLSEETASFQAHPHCACIAAPVWNRNEAWLGHSKQLYEEWKEATKGQSGKDALRAWRRHWSTRDNDD